MITSLSHYTIFVLDQAKAKEFYVDKLGFNVHTDMSMDNGFRWLTVTAPAQPDVEIVLADATRPSPMFTDEQRAMVKTLLEQNAMGCGVMNTPDCRKTYEELLAKGVEFKDEPKEQFYGVECIMLDGCGNWFSVTTPSEHH